MGSFTTKDFIQKLQLNLVHSIQPKVTKSCPEIKTGSLPIHPTIGNEPDEL
ncbi:hypothetical protein JOD07_002098 [Defluviitalea raffinosedens]|jgi:hypothetical protein|nr:hypothetical protein [Defluviitalea raffinosedens]